MKRLIFPLLMLAVFSLFSVSVNGDETGSTIQLNKDTYAEIKFDNTRINLGTFSEEEPVRKCTFKFTNTGTAPLVIHQAFASCGCTVPTYTKTPIKPGETGEVNVTYNGQGKFPGHFQKTITVRSNSRNEVVRLIIEGNMLSKEEAAKK